MQTQNAFARRAGSTFAQDLQRNRNNAPKRLKPSQYFHITTPAQALRTRVIERGSI